MSERLITPPAALAVSMDAARRAARAPGAEFDDELADKVSGITEKAEHDTGRAFVTQTWQLTLDAFPLAIKLSHPPIVSIVHVKFYAPPGPNDDPSGVQQTLDARDYLLDRESEPGWLMPAPGRAWPATAARAGAVEVQYVCGYGSDFSSVPAGIRSYILGMLENEYFPGPNAQHLASLLDRYWVYL